MSRLQKSIRSGRFAGYTQQKKWQIWNRLCRYARQLGIKLKAPLAAACLAAGLTFATPAAAQTFTQQTGAANPLNGADVGAYSKPVFVDIDNDGDLDAVIGGNFGTIAYYKNTGTATVPVLTLQTGAADPFNGINVGTFSAPAFADIDGDNDKDLFIGAQDGTIRYYQNTGSISAPVFTVQTGAANPFNTVDVGNTAIPTLVDIDGDGDMDAFVGGTDGVMRYYKNTGTSAVPVMSWQTGAANPVNNGMYIAQNSKSAFVDIDKDGDMDVFIGSYDGNFRYFQNTGTPTAPAFTEQTGVNNPFNGIDIGYGSAPGFADIDGDGDMDMFSGENPGTILYYRNNSILLPLHLVSFSCRRQAGYNQLQWEISGETNTKWFELEQSGDGNNFIKIVTINIEGNRDNNYTASDNAVYRNKVFYRLKMVDADGRFTYSQVIWINGDQSHGVSIYPNPVRNLLNIDIGNAQLLKTNAGIFDNNGRLLQNILINSNQQQLNVQSFAKGVYIIKFKDGTVQSFIKK